MKPPLYIIALTLLVLAYLQYEQLQHAKAISKALDPGPPRLWQSTRDHDWTQEKVQEWRETSIFYHIRGPHRVTIDN